MCVVFKICYEIAGMFHKAVLYKSIVCYDLICRYDVHLEKGFVDLGHLVILLAYL